MGCLLFPYLLMLVSFIRRPKKLFTLRRLVSMLRCFFFWFSWGDKGGCCLDLHNNCLSALSGSLAVLCGLFFPLCLCHLSFPGRQGLGSQGDTLLCQYRRILENSYILMLFYHLQKIYQCYQREERRSNMDFISYYSLHLCCLDKQIFLFCLLFCSCCCCLSCSSISSISLVSSCSGSLSVASS